MERHDDLCLSAVRKLHIADQLVTSTYTNVQNPRLLISSIENTFLALSYSMGAILHYEQKGKRIPVFKDRFEEKLILYKKYIIPRYHLNAEYASLMKELRDIIVKHQQSAVEIVKNNELIIFDDNYAQRKIGPDQIKEYISKSREFVKEVNMIISAKDDSHIL